MAAIQTLHIKSQKGEEVNTLADLEGLMSAIREATIVEPDRLQLRFVITLSGKIRSVEVKEITP